MSDFLLAAIREQPDDDLARLAYADRLEEGGDSDRADFIRLQLELDRQPPRSRRSGELTIECDAILAERERHWLGEWSERLVGWIFRRGFLDSVTLEPEVFLAFGKELFETHPIREVRFVGSNGDAVAGDAAEEIVACPHFSWVRALDASGSTRSAALEWSRALARSPNLRRLEELNFSSSSFEGSIDLEGLDELCRAEHLRTLRGLDLSLSPVNLEAFDNHAVARLTNAPFYTNLTSLKLAGWGLDAEGLEALLWPRGVSSLEELDLSWCERLTRQDLQKLLDSKRLPKLTTLGLGGDIDITALARSPLLGQLEQLGVCTNTTRHFRTFPASGWDALAGSPHIGGLRRMSLLHGLFDADGFTALFGPQSMLRLYSLMLMGNPREASAAQTAQTLADSPALAEVTALELLGCNIDPEAMEALMNAPFLPGLRQFCVAGNRIGARGLEALMRSPLENGSLDDLHLHHCNLPAGVLTRLFSWSGLANVTRLELGSNAIDLDVMEAMLSSRHLDRLTTLEIGSGVVEPAALIALAQARPHELPRLRNLTLPEMAAEDVVEDLRGRFGAKLKINRRG